MVDRPTRPTESSEFSKIVFSDFTNNLGIHPVNGNVTRLINRDSVKQALRNLIMTNTSERIYNPNMGCDVYKMLFETTVSDSDTFIMRDRIIKNIRAFEPRIELIDVEISSSADIDNKINSVTGELFSSKDLTTGNSFENSLLVNIIFKVINTQETLNVNILVERTR